VGRVVARWAIAQLALLALSGCGRDIEPVEAVVTYRDVVPAHTETYYVPCGKIMIPRTRHVPTAYRVWFAYEDIRVAHTYPTPSYGGWKLGDRPAMLLETRHPLLGTDRRLSFRL
jgi:hypothetical protein